MRIDTLYVSAYLVDQLHLAWDRLKVVDDGGDIVHVKLKAGGDVMIYLIESPITLYEIKNTLARNDSKGIHSLFVLWRDLLLPDAGSVYRHDRYDWMAALVALYGEKVYAYDAYGPEIFIFPVHFDGTGSMRSIRFGDAINAARLGVERVYLNHVYVSGFYRVAHFEADVVKERKQEEARRTPIHLYFERLGIAVTTDRDLVKRRYRELARQYHPDLNASSEATARMQQINEAYTRIMQQMDDDQERAP
ncbi:MAG: J domain-containing protein [Blastochloris sp.]|nr:J domain-containing protein [Blastochloris sp.]